MRDRKLVRAVVPAAIVCCGAMALVAGLVGGVASAAIGRFTAVLVAGLGVVVLVAWVLDRRGHRRDPSGDTNDRSAHLQGTKR